MRSSIKLVSGLIWLIVELDLSWDKQQFDQVWKREDATHESNYAKSYWKKDLLEYKKKRSAAIKSEEKKIKITHERRDTALTEISATIELNKKEAILAKLVGEEDMDDLNELAELEMKMFGKIIDNIIS